MPLRLLPAAVPAAACILAGLLVLATRTEQVWLLAAAVLLVQAVIAAGPAAPAARDHTVHRFAPVIVAALVATLVTVRPDLLAGPDASLAGVDLRLDSGVLMGLPVGVVVGVAAALLAQMLRRDDRAALVVTVSDAVSAVVFAALAVGWVSAFQSSGPQVIAMGAVGVAGAAVVWAVPGERLLVGSFAVVVAIGLGAAVPLVVAGPGTVALGIAVAGAAGLSALFGLTVAAAWVVGREDEADGIGTQAALAVALAGPAVHVGAQLVSLAL